ncbi:hypothetical protein AB0I10_00465 [Streptomyces sp. NPDC050636]|uniref:hypothetical protein n=1 Tax=Streptomyces sp. NPDC050636 TaxID=3154510 RepID=UPI00342725D6
MPRPYTPTIDPSDPTDPTDLILPADPLDSTEPLLAAPPLPTPPRCEVPHFEPVRAGSVRHRWRRATRQRLLAAGLAMTAAALATGIPADAVRAASAPGCPAATTSGAR